MALYGSDITQLGFFGMLDGVTDFATAGDIETDAFITQDIDIAVLGFGDEEDVGI